MARSYLSFSFNRDMLTGPNISSGVENRDMRYSNDRAPEKAEVSRCATIDLAIPGGPNKIILSPAIAASNAILISVSFS